MSENHEVELLNQIEVTNQRECPCGHDFRNHMVSQIGEYTRWGWFWVLFGVTTEPVRVRFVCRRCQTTVGLSDDPRVLRRDV